MAVPLSSLRPFEPLSSLSSLGEYFDSRLKNSDEFSTLLDCLCFTSNPAIHPQTSTRPPLTHAELRSFISDFYLPTRKPLAPGDRVMLALPTGPENAVALLALLTYHVCVPVNASCTASEVRKDASRLKIRALVATKDAVERLGLCESRDEIGCEILFIEPRSLGAAGLFDICPMDGMVVPPGLREFQPHALKDHCLLLHTSGTSGSKKVVSYALKTLIIGTSCVVHSWGLRETDVNLNMMPFFHVGGIVRNLLAPILSGGSTIVCSGFDPLEFWRVAQQLKATWYYAAPTIHHAVLAVREELKILTDDVHIRMICNAADGLLPFLAAELKAAFHNAVVLPSYGMTECMPIASPPTDYQLDRPGCSGLACGPQLSIRDPSSLHQELSNSEVGSICVRGPPLFDGYETSVDASSSLDKSAITLDGWFDTGDIGYMDNDGYLYVTGRSKEIINRGGEVISPMEIEDAILTAAKDCVKNALVFSVKHVTLQEAIGAIIVPVPYRQRIGLSQLQELLKGHLHSNKWPFLIVYMTDIPKNSANKPQRINLSSRLGLRTFTDTILLIERHFDAQTISSTSLSESIPCERVTVDLEKVKKEILNLSGVQDVALNANSFGSMEAYVHVKDRPELDAVTMKSELFGVLPGYAIPDFFYVLRTPLSTNEQGNHDFVTMQAEATKRDSSTMSELEILVRDSIAAVLDVDPGRIKRDSDFFLLGGNSLLLGHLSFQIRKLTRVSIPLPTFFANSTISGIASAIQDRLDQTSPTSTFFSEKPPVADSRKSLLYDYEQNQEQRKRIPSRGQTHIVSLFVQAIPLILFYPMKSALTWTVLLFVLSYLARLYEGSFWERMGALLAAILSERLCVHVISPLAAITLKWTVIGRYKPGNYSMWSSYHLRWWIVDQSLTIAGKGIFSMHPCLEILYYRMLGAHIGKDVHISEHTRLGEFDLLTIADGCLIDGATVRGFSVEREGIFRLGTVTIGHEAVVNTYTTVSPGTVVDSGAVYGPHASTHDLPSPQHYAAYSRVPADEPHWVLKLLIAWPIIFLVYFVSYLPWFLSIWLMIKQTIVSKGDLNAIEAVVYWFSTPRRVVFHTMARIIQAILTPLLQLFLGIFVKRVLGLNKECKGPDVMQLAKLRRYVNSTLLSRKNMKNAFSILGTHYEAVSSPFVKHAYRAMGAKVGRRVYWPGTGIYCPDPELLEIGDDVVFGSRSELFTSDRLGSEKIVVGDGAMVADRVVLLPGTRIGKRVTMGTGALGKRNETYQDGSTWVGNYCGEAICLSKTPKMPDTIDNTTPFGRAFYKGGAAYFVFPYCFILAFNVLVAAFSAAYWSAGAVATAQLLKLAIIHLPHLHLFRPSWYRFGTLYGLIAVSFIALLTTQAILAAIFAVFTKWHIIGRRQEGQFDWDKSSYCQRWQLHLTLSRILRGGYGPRGVLGPITGSAYLVWFLRAMGAKIGKNCSIYAGGRLGLMAEPDLVELGDNVALDDCSVVAHINTRGHFSLNRLKIGNGCALRSGSRLLSGASMEDGSMLCEHTLLTSGEVAEDGGIYTGWPGNMVREPLDNDHKESDASSKPITPRLMCPVCQHFPKDSTIAVCGHLFCAECINKAVSKQGVCPVCAKPSTRDNLRKVYLSVRTQDSS